MNKQRVRAVKEYDKNSGYGSRGLVVILGKGKTGIYLGRLFRVWVRELEVWVLI